MRGKVRHAGLRCMLSRITPAHAGKRPFAQSPKASIKDHPRPCGEKDKSRSIIAARKDHPRPCGEKYTLPFIRILKLGSPPPMRGKAALAPALVPALGITPAHAGKARAARDPQAPAGITPAHAGKRLRKRRNTGIFFFQISRFHSVSHTPDTSYGNRPALYVRRLPRTPAALQASKAY